MMQEYFCRDLKELAYEDGRPRTSSNNSMAGAPGLEPGNGGIKIQMVRVICQRAFRKNAEIRPQSDQEVSGNFGMQGRVAPCCDAPRPPKAEVTRSKSCRARQRINGLAGPATKFEKKASSDRFMHVPPGRRSNSLLSSRLLVRIQPGSPTISNT